MESLAYALFILGAVVFAYRAIVTTRILSATIYLACISALISAVLFMLGAAQVRMAVRKAVFGSIFLLIFLLILAIRPAGALGQAEDPQAPETVPAFLERLQSLLRNGDRECYLAFFAPEIRADEADRLAMYFDSLGMTGISLRSAGVRTPAQGAARVFVQAFYENARAAIVESWTLTLARRDGTWSVTALDIPGNPTRLYKIGLPAERVVRVRRIEVVHTDIRLSFEDSAVYYDNIPDVDTAMIIVRRGKVVFTRPAAAVSRQ